MLKKGNDAKNPAMKERTKEQECTVAQKIETDYFCRNVPISNDPVVRISRDLATK